MSDSGLQSLSIDKYFNNDNKNTGNTANNTINNTPNDKIETIDLSPISSSSNKKTDNGGDSAPKTRKEKILSILNEQVIDPSETYSSLDEMEKKLKSDNKKLEDRKEKMVFRLDQLKKQYDDACRDPSLDMDAKPDDDLWRNRLGMTKSEFEECINATSEHIDMLNKTIKSNNATLKKIPYLKKMDDPDFTNFVQNYKSDWQDGVDYEDVYYHYTIGNHNLTGYQKLDGKEVDWISVVEYMLAKDKNLVIDEHDSLRDSYLKYEAMDESQRLMYHYLFKTEGLSSAEHYLNDIIGDDVRKNRALNRVERKIKKMAKSYVLDKDGHIVQASIDATLENLIGSYGSGFEDAIKGNYTGLFKFDKDNYTEEEYEQMFMLQYLNQNGMLKGAYDSGSVGGTVSNMFMSMIMYTGATYLSGGTALAGIVPYLYQAGTIATSVANTGGNARHYALVNGASEEEADQYSSAIMRNNLFTQVTSAVVSRGIGATSQYSSIINGSNTLSFPTNVAISAANTVVGATTATWEVGQEQELKSALLHEKPLDLSTATDQMVETFVSNIIMGGLSEVPGLALCKYSMQWDGKVFEFDTDDCLAFFRDNPDATASDFADSLAKVGNKTNTKTNTKTALDSYLNSSNTSQISPKAEFNAVNMKNEINSKIKPGMSDDAIARSLYLELNKRVDYDANYFFDRSDSVKNSIYGNELGFDNMNSSNVICKGWSELYRDLLIENGFDSSKVKIMGDSESGSHKWVEITMNDGSIIIADGTKTYRGVSDLANCKIGGTTYGFIKTTSDNSGKTIGYENYMLAETSQTQWKKVDATLDYGYGGEYYDDIIVQADKFFSSSSSTNTSDSYMMDLATGRDFPDSFDGLSCFAYYRKISKTLYNGGVYAEPSIHEHKVGGEVEFFTSVLIRSPDGARKFLTYSSSTGKHIFDSYDAYKKYYDSLNLRAYK